MPSRFNFKLADRFVLETVWQYFDQKETFKFIRWFNVPYGGNYLI